MKNKNNQPTQAEVNRLIAETLGWTRFCRSAGPIGSGKQLLGNWQDRLYGTPPEDKDKPEDDQAFEAVPTFWGSLDEMRKVVNRLLPGERDDYINWLSRICHRKHRMATITWLVLTSEAQDQAEAYLRVKKLWRWK